MLIVIDFGNGLYEILFLVLVFGNYCVLVVLDYLFCDGMKDFFDYWFILGKEISIISVIKVFICEID